VAVALIKISKISATTTTINSNKQQAKHPSKKEVVADVEAESSAKHVMGCER